MGRIKMGIIGMGRIGRVHIMNIATLIDKFQIMAVADPYAKDLDKLADKYGIPKVYDDYQELLNVAEVEAVVVATSTNTHAEVSIAAALAGKHVFCEKPVDTKVQRIKEVIAAMEKADVKFQVGFNRRFDHNFRRVREYVASGAVGVPHIIKVTSRDPEPPPIEYVKISGGIFNDMMIHDFDMVRYLSGSEVVEVNAVGAVLINPAIGEAGDVDTAIVTLKFENGAIGVIDNSRQAVYGYDQRVEVFGSKGQAVAYNDKPTTVELSTRASVTTDKIPHFFLDRYTGAFIDQFIEFYHAIKEDRVPIVTGSDGLKSVEIALAATKSFKEGKTVKL